MVSSFVFFCLSLVSRLLSARFNIVEDCDETYNYWEPTHLLLYGSGLQTWEYAPQYALRSYWYPLCMSLFAWPLKALQMEKEKLFVWFALRSVLGVLCAVCETYLFVAAKRRWQKQLSALFVPSLAVVLLFAPGLWTASTALLPNSLSMCLYMLSFACWLQNNHFGALFWGAASAFLGVPFSALMLVFMALDVLRKHGLVRPVLWGLFAVAVTFVPQVLIDRVFYQRWVVAVFNLVHYNALSSDADSALYGVEPYSFYVKNLVLNLNVAFPLAVVAVPFALVFGRKSPTRWSDVFVLLSPFVWMAFLFALPHKEQRFLYPALPLLLLNAAYVVGVLGSERRFFVYVSVAILAVFVALGASRIAALNVHRGAPVRAWASLHNDKSTLGKNVRVCLGDDWYRFPSSFFLRDGMRVDFVRSGFKGLLPKHYALGPNATSEYVSNMNRFNKEETDRYVDPSTCSLFVVEREQIAPKDSFCERIIDDDKSPALFRAFYVPFLGEKRNKFKQYCFAESQ